MRQCIRAAHTRVRTGAFASWKRICHRILRLQRERGRAAASLGGLGVGIAGTVFLRIFNCRTCGKARVAAVAGLELQLLTVRGEPTAEFFPSMQSTQAEAQEEGAREEFTALAAGLDLDIITAVYLNRQAQNVRPYPSPD